MKLKKLKIEFLNANVENWFLKKKMSVNSETVSKVKNIQNVK